MKTRTILIGLMMGGLLPGLGPTGAGAQDDDAPVIRSRRLDEPASQPGEPRGAGYDTAKPAPKPTLRIGISPVLIDGRKRVETMATVFGEVGVGLARNAPWLAEWGQMQKWSEKSTIKFNDLDQFVTSFQNAGVEEIMISLRSNCKWASRNYDKERSRDPTPKPEYQEAFQTWISAIVERYDGDGKKDMEGLKRPVRIYEIGDRFSAREPAPAEAYVEMLKLAYAAAHEAYEEVQIAHAGFVTTEALLLNPKTGELRAAFEANARLLYHDLADVRSVLDAHEAFDLVNLHSLGEPRELDAMVKWIRYEMEQRGIDKPIIIGEATPSPLLTHGPATDCTLAPENMGVVIAPAAESDRCRLAQYFTNLLGGDEYTELWARRYAASDLVKKVVIAADHELMLINVSPIEDSRAGQKRSYQAASGHIPWSGLADLGEGRRPAFFAVHQLAILLRDYDDVQRLAVDDPAVVIYQITRGDSKAWVGWLEPDQLALPGDASPRIEIDLPVSTSVAIIERMISKQGQLHPVRKSVIPIKGILPVVLTPYPTYIHSRF